MSDLSLLGLFGVHSYSNCDYRVMEQFDFSEFGFSVSILLKIYPYLKLLFKISCKFWLSFDKSAFFTRQIIIKKGLKKTVVLK